MNTLGVTSVRKVALLLLFSLTLALDTRAQSREAGLMIGAMGYRGDLDQTMYDTRFLDPAIGILYRRSYSNHWAFKTGINYGIVQADDAESENAWERNRNLHFKSSILEWTGQIEFNFFPYQTASPFSKFSPFIFFGLSAFHFNPKAEYNGTWVKLQPLCTEGQGTEQYPDRKKYGRITGSFVYGGGFKFKVMRRFGVMLETGVRPTFTDYLDDVSSTYVDPLLIRREYGKTAAALSDRSLDKDPAGNIGRQRGDRRQRDWYVFSGIQITYTLSKKYIDSCRPFRIKLW